MKRITLIQTPITNTQAPKDFILNYRDVFLEMIEKVPEGITVSQMRVAIKIAEKLQGLRHYGASALILEDAEWEYLRAKAVNWKFGMIAPEIVVMVDAVVNAENYEHPQKAETAQA